MRQGLVTEEDLVWIASLVTVYSGSLPSLQETVTQGTRFREKTSSGTVPALLRVGCDIEQIASPLWASVPLPTNGQSQNYSQSSLLSTHRGPAHWLLHLPGIC